MKCIILEKKASEFTTKEGTLLKGVNLTIFRENLTAQTYWVPADKLIQLGFVDKMLSNPFSGDKVQLTEITFDEKAGYQGKPSKIVPTSFKMA